MTFSELALSVIDALRGDGDYVTTPPSSGSYATSPFGKRLIRSLKRFTIETYSLFTDGVSMTVVSGDRTIDLSDTNKCSKYVCYPVDVWAKGQRIARIDSIQEIQAGWNPASPTLGVPSAWARLDDRQIIFDKRPNATVTDCWVSGFYEHPAITTDGADVLLSSRYAELFERYASVMMRQDVAADQIGLARLQRVDAQAARTMRDARAEALKKYLDQGRR